MGTGPSTDEFYFAFFRLDGRRHINRRCGEIADTCVVDSRFWDGFAGSGEAFLMV